MLLGNACTVFPFCIFYNISFWHPWPVTLLLDKENEWRWQLLLLIVSFPWLA